MRGTSKLVVAILASPHVVTAAGAADASGQEGDAEGRDEPEADAGSGGIQVKVKGLTKGKVKLKAKSSTFDHQELRKLTKPAKVQAHSKTAGALLPLTLKGEIQSPAARRARSSSAARAWARRRSS